MVIHTWAETVQATRLAERARICAALQNQLPLLNFESEIRGGQMPLN